MQLSFHHKESLLRATTAFTCMTVNDVIIKASSFTAAQVVGEVHPKLRGLLTHLYKQLLLVQEGWREGKVLNNTLIAISLGVTEK